MADYWISQSGSGIANGTSATTPAPYTFFNTAANWSSPNVVAGKISPGDYVHLVGVVSGGTHPVNGTVTGLTFQANGLPGTPITLLFEQGSRLSSPYWGQAGQTTGGSAIFGNKNSNIVINGSGVGIIECTNNGVSGANQVMFASAIVNFAQGTPWSGWLIENLTIQNIYVPVYSGSSFGSTGATVSYAILLQDGGSLSVQNCNINNAYYGINVGPTNSTLLSGVILSGNHLSACATAIASSLGNTNTSMSGVSLFNNNITMGTSWVDIHDTHHIDGIHVFGQNDASPISGLIINGNIISGDCSHNSTAYIYIEDEVINPIIVNNLMVSTNNVPSDGHIDIKRLGGKSGAANNVTIANNTFIGLGSGGSGGRAIYVQDTSGDSYSVYNNLILSISQGVFSTNPVASGKFIGDYNDYYNVGVVGFWGNVSYKTLASWASAITGESHSSTLNPLLNQTNTLVAGSPAIQMGTNLSLVFTNDIINNSRPNVGPWDLGAYFFNPVLGTIFQTSLQGRLNLFSRR